jgi:ubiquinone/menaquinone biosynthesis C-methylase UbiE
MSQAAELAPATPDLLAVKSRQRAAWSAGNYAVIGTTLQIVGETLCEAADIRAGERVLDVAAGNGNAALAAARRFGKVTASDYVPALLDSARVRAAAEGAVIDFREADAENLPFDSASFDVALSTFGVMFAPNQRRAASELMRVVRGGGRIALANWTPSGFIGQVFATLAKYIPPPKGLQSPSRWGSREWLEAEFGPYAVRVTTVPKDYVFRYASASHWLDVFRTWYGPIHTAFQVLDTVGQRALADDLTALIHRFNRSGSEAVVLPSQYLEVVIEMRDGSLDA